MLCISMLLYVHVMACDVCGCAPGNATLGIMPKSNKHLLGLGYQFNAFTSLPHHGDQQQKTFEVFHQTQLWGRVTLKKRFQLLAFAPYKFQTRIQGDKKLVMKGLGDISLLANYIVVNSEPNKKRQHFIVTGLGVKLPTGEYNALDNGLMIHPNMQIGSGSTDFQYYLQYTVRSKKIGLFSELNYYHNGRNDMQFSFGNRLNSTLRIFKWFKKSSIMVLPQAGMSAEHADPDQLFKVNQDFTGGNSVLGSVGLDLYIQNFGFMLHAHIPIFQEVGNGHITNAPRVNLNFIYLF